MRLVQDALKAFVGGSVRDFNEDDILGAPGSAYPATNVNGRRVCCVHERLLDGALTEWRRCR